MNRADEKLTAVVNLATTIPDTTLRRAVVNAVLDLQDSWREVAQGFVAKQRELNEAAGDHIDGVATAQRIDQYAGAPTA